MTPARPAATSIPSGWPAPDPAVLDRACAAALDALSTSGTRPVQVRLAEYYDATLEQVGSTFLDVEPNLTDDVTAADLLALHLLGVAVGPLDARQLLQAGPVRRVVVASLGVLPDGDLALADAATLEAMEVLRADVAAALADRPSRERWDVAELLCARKRPDLFPLPDPVVRQLLAPGHVGADHRTDWLIHRHLLRDTDVRAALWTAQDAASEVPGHEQVVLDLGLLRVLGVALRTYVARSGQTASLAAEAG